MTHILKSTDMKDRREKLSKADSKLERCKIKIYLARIVKFHFIPPNWQINKYISKSDSWQKIESKKMERLSSIPNVNGSYYSFWGSDLARRVNIKNTDTLWSISIPCRNLNATD